MTAGQPAPYWLTFDPAWCTEEHTDSDCADDRIHYGPWDGVELTTIDPVRVSTDEWLPLQLTATLTQHVRDAEPRIALNDTADAWSTYLTLDEALQLRDILDALCAAARPVQASPGEGCRVWCADHQDDDGDELGGSCRAADVEAPAEVGQASGVVRLTGDPEDGVLLHLRCKTEELTVGEARRLAAAILAQVERAALSAN